MLSPRLACPCGRGTVRMTDTQLQAYESALSTLRAAREGRQDLTAAPEDAVASNQRFTVGAHRVFEQA